MVFDLHGLPSPIVNKYIDLFDCLAKKKKPSSSVTSNWQKIHFNHKKWLAMRCGSHQKSSPLGYNSQYLYFEFSKSALKKKTATSTCSPILWCFFHPLNKRNNTTTNQQKTTTQRFALPIIMAPWRLPFDSLLHLRFLTHLSWANATFDELLFRRPKEAGRRRSVRNDWGPPVVGPPQNGGRVGGFWGCKL